MIKIGALQTGEAINWQSYTKLAIAPFVCASIEPFRPMRRTSVPQGTRT
jgi:hypothetical protein